MLSQIYIDVKEIENLVKELQSKYEVGSSEWHVLENIDDRVFDMLVQIED